MGTKLELVNKGILYICHKFEGYSKLNINTKINIKSEVAYYWSKWIDNFHQDIKPIIQETKNKNLEKFIFQEYFFSRGL
ncbi:hypothetical protein CO037_00540 [Candidatus Pacearchaeota archaeon CG_4_9_14_0_2_um_filter_30_8]|nr:MAG: hypothetical protein CO037_00540 [Candidatus Pacearchaeota archaeon CG_4_9_14_0_2_um_filter_30_8]